MATLQVKSLYGSARSYTPFALEVNNGKTFAVASTADGLIRAEVKAELPFDLGDGLYVMQAAKNPNGGAHVQFKTEQGNRAYGWSFDTNDPAIVSIA